MSAPDPLAEIRQTLRALAPDQYRRTRQAVILKARALGLTWKEISEELGMKPQVAQQLAKEDLDAKLNKPGAQS